MKILTQLIISVVLFCIALLIIAASIAQTNQKVDRLNAQEALANNIVLGASDLSFLSNDYLVYNEPLQLDRWNTKFAEFSNDVSNLSANTPEQQALVNNIKEDKQQLKAVFENVVSSRNNQYLVTNSSDDKAFIQLSWSRLAVQTRGIVFDASSLYQMLLDQENQVKQTNNLIIMALLGVFGAFVLTIFFLVFGSTIKSVGNLKAGAKIIGSGNLDYRIKANKSDEVGELADEFNQMTARLKTVTASKADLENEITERKRAEEVLRESEERFRTLADNIPNLAWMANADGWIFWYNKQWYDYTGTTLEEMQGWGWQKVHHPDYLKAVTEKWSASIKAGQPYEDIFPLRGKDGNYRWFLTRVTPIRDAQGNIQRWFGTNTDITERKRAEEALQKQAAMIDLSPDGIIVRKLDGEITFWSRGAEALYGWTEQEAIGRQTHSLLQTRFPEPLEVIIQQLKKTGHWSGELVHSTKDGRQVVVQSWWLAQFDSERNVTEIMESNVDLTKRKQAEDALRDEKQQAELYLDLMGHDISNMHQIILGQLQLAEEIINMDGKLEGDDKAIIDVSIKNLERSAKLIDNVRNLQKLRAGEFRAEPVDLGQVLDDAVAAYSSVADKNVSIEYARAEGHVARVNPLIKEVFNNLLDNAVKHSGDPVRIRVVMDKVNRNGRWYHRASIEDNGPGIPDKRKGEVFHRLKRGDAKVRGTGLGLYIVKTLAESFDGIVEVKDRVEGDYTQGSRFLVYLPVVEGENDR